MSISNIPLGLIGFAGLVLILTALIPIQQGADVDEIVSKLDWDSMNSTQVFKQENENIVVNVAYKFIDFMGYSLFEVTKAAVRWGSENLNVSVRLILIFVFASILAPVALSIFKIGIISVILVKEYFQSKSEQEELQLQRKKK